MEQVIGDDLVIWPDEQPGNMERPRYKTYFDPEKPKMKAVSTWIDSNAKKVPAKQSLPVDVDEEEEDYDGEDEIQVLTSGLNSEGRRALRNILGRTAFNYPKPPSLVSALVRLATTGNDTILDSFAGSGTTAQSVLELNNLDGMQRRFILIQLRSETLAQSQTNICRDVTAERVRRVIKGYSYKSAKGNKETRVKPTGGSFTYAKLSDSPLLGEYRSLAPGVPYSTLAQYVYFTETSRTWDPTAADSETGLIGVHDGCAYYLLYRADGDDQGTALDRDFLRKTASSSPFLKLVVYSEKLWLHREELRTWEAEQLKSLRFMHVPFNLK